MNDHDSRVDGPGRPEAAGPRLIEFMVPMRDGTRLATDVYLPTAPFDGPAARWPVVLERTPYDKRSFNSNTPSGADYTSRGFAYVRQDVRGRHRSEGEFGCYPQEGPDGLDCFDWVRGQPWCDGRIGVTGSSYYASTAQAILVQNPPGLLAAVIRVGAGNYHEEGAWQGGAFLAAHNVNYVMSLASTGREAMRDARVRQALAEAMTAEGLLGLMRGSPLRPGSSPLASAPSYERWYLEWQRHELLDEYWRANGNSFTGHYRNASSVPILLIAEWYDAFIGGMLDAWQGYSSNPGARVRLLIGGGEHQNVYSMRSHAGEIDLGPESPIDIPGEILSWFERCVGDDPGEAPSSGVRAFRIEGGDGSRNDSGHIVAGGRWQEFDRWPPCDSRSQRLHLHAGGVLKEEIPARPGTVEFDFDPLDPVPTVGGPVSSGGTAALAGPYDQSAGGRPLSDRADVCVFATAPLEFDVDVTGPVSVTLWVSSSAADTDFTAKLVDQHPPRNDGSPGVAVNVLDSIVRARLREFEQAHPAGRRFYGILDRPLAPGSVVPVCIDLIATSYLFRKGHRIRLDVSSSNFPRFDVNPNTGEPFADRVLDPVVARNAVHFGPEHPSHVELSVRPPEPARSGT